MPRLSFSPLGRAVIGFALLLAALAGAILWWRRELRPDRRKVAVALFANRIGDSTRRAARQHGGGLGHPRLAQSGLVDVVDVVTICVEGRTDAGAPTDPRGRNSSE